MTLTFVGADFHALPLASLERLERAADDIRQQLESNREVLPGAVLLSTCNRFEIYADVPEFHPAFDFILETVEQHTNESSDLLRENLRTRYATDVAAHLFSVASGLRSMIVGEEEIAGQVKRAFAKAQASSFTTRDLNQMFQLAAKVSKRVVTQTGLGASGRSIVSTALDLAQEELGNLSGKRALLVGTGAYARVAVAALNRKGIDEIYCYSRSGRAGLFSENHGLTPVQAPDFENVLASSDVAVFASGSSQLVLSREAAERVCGLRAEAGSIRNLQVIDVALSRDVDPAAAELNGLKLIDLEMIRINAPREHQESVEAAYRIVNEGAKSFEQGILSQSTDALVAALHAHMRVWVNTEVEAVRKKLGDQAAEEVEKSLRKVTNRILHGPSVKAKALAKEGLGDEYERALKMLFDVTLEAAE